MNEPLLHELSVPGRSTITVPIPEVPVPPMDIPASLLRDSLPLPEVGEPEVVRHFTRISRLNMSIDTNFYPLGSCTMKYNPKVNDAMAAMVGYEVVSLRSTECGNVDLDALHALLDDDVAGLMITVPSTLGLFDEGMLDLSRLVHEAGGLVYGDGANLNALLGVVRPR